MAKTDSGKRMRIVLICVTICVIIFACVVIFLRVLNSSDSGRYDRGDIVVIDASNMRGYDSTNGYLVKRIIGLPGDTIRIADGNVYLKKKGEDDFYLFEESYLEEGTRTTVMAYGVEMGYDEITLGDDEYYCMGDNRPVSNDSRNLGPFTIDRFIEKMDVDIAS